MGIRKLLIAVLAGMLGMTAAAMAPPGIQKPDPAALSHVLTSGSVDSLAGSLRGYLIHAVHDPLFESSSGWGHQSRVARGVKWTGKELPLKPEIIHGLKNQGDWRKLRVTAPNLADNLILDLRDVKPIEPGRMTFVVFLAFDGRAYYQHQKWEAGVKLYDGSARGRFHTRLTLNCELTSRLESSGLFLSDLIFRIRVLRSDLGIDNLVLEHVGGVGGEAAKLIGEAVKHTLKEWHPSLERDLLAKANAAIVKSGDTKEIRVSLFNLMKNQGLAAATPKPAK